MKGGENINTGLVIKNLSKAFQNRKVLEGLSVEAANGSRTLLVGPSGAGKSTLLRIIAGLDLPDAGEVYLEGELASTNKWSLEPQKRKIGFVFQNPT